MFGFIQILKYREQKMIETLQFAMHRSLAASTLWDGKSLQDWNEIRNGCVYAILQKNNNKWLRKITHFTGKRAEIKRFFSWFSCLLPKQRHWVVKECPLLVISKITTEEWSLTPPFLLSHGHLLSEVCFSQLFYFTHKETKVRKDNNKINCRKFVWMYCRKIKNNTCRNKAMSDNAIEIL